MKPGAIGNLVVATDLAEAVGLVEEGFLPLAGGTDLIPRCTLGLLDGVSLVHISGIPEIAMVACDGETLSLGSAVTLADLSVHPSVPAWLRAACLRVASAGIRTAATLGGNLLQAPRCRFLNRPFFWRSAHGACLRTGGAICRAGGDADECHASQRSLLAAVLLAADARLEFLTSRGPTTITLESLYPRDLAPADLQAPGLLSRVIIPNSGSKGGIRWEVLTRRTSIDYPEIALAVAEISPVSKHTPPARRIAVSAPLPWPRLLPPTISDSSGDFTDLEEALTTIFPSVQTGLYDPAYLRHAAAVLLQRAVRRS